MNVAIHYTSIQPPTGRERQVFGLHVAVATLLKAYFRYARSETFSFLIGAENEWREVQELAAQAGIDKKRLVALDRRFPEQNLGSFSTVFRAEPDTRRMLWQRQVAGSYAFCSLAHAISGVEAGDVLEDYCLSPSRANDAIICPSHAVKNAIVAFWESYGDYLNQRFGANYRCPVQLPVIPLGIDVEAFANKCTEEKRAKQRKRLGIADDEIVLLWVGRLSAAIKAHPLAMYQAAERAAKATGAKVHLVMVGYFVPEDAEKQFKKLAADVCPSVKITFIAANDARFPDGLWASGDIFLSLVDNMQESFGLTPIEAMAAGLPRVISDWDGYRDSVNDGEDGFLVPTTLPPAKTGFNLTAQVLSGREVYSGFLAKAALMTAVDADVAAQRLAQLINDKDLRLLMAEKAKERVRATYDWARIIPAYEDLWIELEKKKTAPSSERYASALPQLPDPFTMYRTYPTRQLSEDDVLSLAMPVDDIKMLWQYQINTYANDSLIAPQHLTALLAMIAEKQNVAIASIFRSFPSLDRAMLWHTIGWLQKLGIVKNSTCEVMRQA